MEQVGGAHGQVKYVTRLGSGRVVVVVLRPRWQDVGPRGAIVMRFTGRDSIRERSPFVSTVKTDGRLLIGGQCQRICEVVQGPNNEPAIVAPSKAGPPAILGFLIVHVHVLLINLIVILAVGAYRQIRIENEATVFRTKESGVRMTHRCVYAQPVNIERQILWSGKR